MANSTVSPPLIAGNWLLPYAYLGEVYIGFTWTVTATNGATIAFISAGGGEGISDTIVYDGVAPDYTGATITLSGTAVGIEEELLIEIDVHFNNSIPTDMYQYYGLNIYSAPSYSIVPIATETPLTSGTVGTLYPDFTWTITGTSDIANTQLTQSPPGMFVSVTPLTPTSATITLGGTPTVAGTYQMTVFITAVNPLLNTPFGPYNITIDPVPCLTTNTKILLSDHSEKMIQNIRRGDIVAADPQISRRYLVSRVLSDQYSGNSVLDICEFKPNSIAQNVPNQTLYITSGHPIVHNGARRASRLFTEFDGVTESKNIKFDNLIEGQNDHRLWDLQFDTVGSYVANGVTVQSRHPQSFITPMPKELYFDQKLYSPEIKNDHDPKYEFPLVYDKITN